MLLSSTNKEFDEDLCITRTHTLPQRCMINYNIDITFDCKPPDYLPWIPNHCA